jgi:hypothetical protein
MLPGTAALLPKPAIAARLGGCGGKVKRAWMQGCPERWIDAKSISFTKALWQDVNF